MIRTQISLSNHEYHAAKREAAAEQKVARRRDGEDHETEAGHMPSTASAR